MINEITDEDKLIIYDLFFEEMLNIEQIERKFKKKYKYSQISFLIRRKVGEYKGELIKPFKKEKPFYKAR